MAKHVSDVTRMGVDIIAGRPHGNGHIGDEALVSFFEKNKYPLVAFEPGRNGYDFFKSGEYLAARERHSRKMETFRDEYLLVRNQWLEAGIACVAIKSGDPFPSFPYTSDNIDILIDKEKEDLARNILEHLGYVELKNLEEPEKFLFRKFNGGKLALDIHLHTRVGWGVGFIDGKTVMNRARVSPDDPAVKIPSPEDVILITLAHSLYENKKIRLADLVRVLTAFSYGVDWPYIIRTAQQAGWKDGLCFFTALAAYLGNTLFGYSGVPRDVLIECQAQVKRSVNIRNYFDKLIQRRPIVLPFTVSFSFTKFLFYRKVLRDRRDNPVYRVYQVIRTLVWGVKLKGHIQPQSSFLISFSGIDGSGKSSHAQLLEKCLVHYDLRTDYRWSRCATGGLTRLFSIFGQALFWRKVKTQKDAQSTTVRRQRLNNPLLRFVWCTLTAGDMIVSNFFRVRLPLLLGRVVISDRYVYDAAAEMKSSLPVIDWSNKLAIAMMMALSPKPDIAYFLDVSDQVSAQRREDNSDLANIRRQREIYLEIAQKNNLQIKWNDSGFDNVFDGILVETALP